MRTRAAGAALATLLVLAVSPSPSAAGVPDEGWYMVETQALSEAAVVVSDDVLYAFVLGLDLQVVLHEFDEGDVGDDIRQLGGILHGDPVAIADPADDGAVYVFGVGRDRAIWFQRVTTDGSSGWRSLGGYVTSQPAVTVDPDGTLHVFVQGLDDGLYHASITPASGTVAAWDAFGGVLSGGVLAASVVGEGSVVFVGGFDGRPYEGVLAGDVFEGWRPLDGPGFQSLVSAGATTHALGIGQDSGDVLVATRAAGGAWSEWSSIGGLAYAVRGYMGPDGLVALALGRDFSAYVQLVADDGTGDGWFPLGGELASAPVGAQHDTGGWVYGISPGFILYRHRV